MFYSTNSVITINLIMHEIYNYRTDIHQPEWGSWLIYRSLRKTPFWLSKIRFQVVEWFLMLPSPSLSSRTPIMLRVRKWLSRDQRDHQQKTTKSLTTTLVKTTSPKNQACDIRIIKLQHTEDFWMQEYAANVTVTYMTFMREEVWYRVKMNELGFKWNHFKFLAPEDSFK